MRIHKVVILAAATLVPVLAQTPKSNPAADWPMYNHDLAGTRYSPLTPINSGKVSSVKWAAPYRRGSAPVPQAGRGEGGRGGGRGAGAVPTVNPEATPIVVNGIMYLPAGRRGLALAAT